MTAIGRVKESKLTLERLKRRLTYDCQTGIFMRLTKKPKVAGTLDKSGYIMIYVNGKNYLAHRLAWFYHYGKWPNGIMDHRNRCKSDNRISNLREATHSQNNANNNGHSKLYAHLPKGVTWRKHGVYAAQIRYQQKTYHLGHFKVLADAVRAYKRAAFKFQRGFAS